MRFGREFDNRMPEKSLVTTSRKDKFYNCHIMKNDRSLRSGPTFHPDKFISSDVSTMEKYNQIKTLLKAHQKIHNKKQMKLCMKLPESAAKFLCLAINARVGFLYDYGALCVECAQQIARDLSQNIEGLEDLITVEFGLDILFVRPGKLMEQLNQDTTCFIDVGGSAPTLMLEKPKDLARLKHRITNLVLEEEKNKEQMLILDTAEFLSGPTVFGLLIGYPISYYIESDRNSLCNTPLAVSKCIVNIEKQELTVCAFSCPVSVVNGNSDISDMITNWKLKIEEAFVNAGICCSVNTTIASFDALTL